MSSSAASSYERTTSSAVRGMLVLAARPRSCRSRKNSSNSPSASRRRLDVLPVQEDAARPRAGRTPPRRAAACARRAGGGSQRRDTTASKARPAGSPSRQPGVARSASTISQRPACSRGAPAPPPASARRSRPARRSTPGSASSSSSAKPPSPAPRSTEPATVAPPRVIRRRTSSSCTSNSGISLRRSSMKPRDDAPRCCQTAPGLARRTRSLPLPDVDEVPLDRRRGGHLRADQVRAPAAALAALEVAVRGRRAALAGLRGCPGSCPGTSSSRPRATRTRRA